MVGAQLKSTGKVPTRSRPMSFQGTTPSPTFTAMVACIFRGLVRRHRVLGSLGSLVHRQRTSWSLSPFDKSGRTLSGTPGRDHTPSSSTSPTTTTTPHPSPPDPPSTGHPSGPLSPQFPLWRPFSPLRTTLLSSFPLEPSRTLLQFPFLP